MSITPRNKWKYPEWDADWQSWQKKSEDLVVGQDASVFSTIEGMKYVFRNLPESQIVGDGIDHVLRITDDLVLISRTLNVALSVKAGDTVLIPNSLICITMAPGLVGPQETEFEIFTNVPIDPDVRVFGYVDEDYNINWYNGSILVKDEPSIRIFSFRGGSGEGEEYYAGTGLDLTVGNVFNHLNSVTAQGTQSLRPIAIDGQGHISAYGSVVTSLPNPNNLILKIKTGTTEGFDLYTYDGSVGKTIDIREGSNITLTEGVGILTISSTNTTYSAGTGLSLSGTTFNHSNSVTAQGTQSLRPIAIDGQGHISGYGTAITSLPTPNSLVLRADGLSVEGTSQYTFDGSVAKTLNIIGGTNVSIAKTSGQWTISSVNTTYSAGTGLSLSGTTFNHSNSVTAQGTQSLRPIAIDGQGHISAYGSAVTALRNPNNFILKIKTGTMEGLDLYTYDGSVGKTIDIREGSNITLTEGVGILTISSTNTTYSAGTGLSLSGTTFNHSNSVTSKTQALYPIAYDGQGHITSSGSVVTSLPNPSSLVLKIKNGSTEGTDLYTYDGSVGKTIDIREGSNVTLTGGVGTLTISATNTTYTSSLGISLVGTDFRHSNSTTVRGTRALYPISIDGQGHVTGSDSAVTSLPNPSSLILRADGLTSEGTGQYTFDGSVAKTLNIIGGTNVSIAKTSGQWTISSVNTTYSAGTGLSLSGTTFNHSNSVTAQATQALYPLTYDAQGHITGAGSAVTTLPNANALTLKIKSGATEGTSRYTYTGATAKTLDFIQGTNVTLTAGSGTLTIASTDTTYPLTQGHIAYGNGTGITGEADLFYDATSKRIGLRTVNPAFGLDINGVSGFGGSLGMSGWASGGYPTMYIRSSRSGTVGSYSATLANQNIARILVQGSSGTEHIDAIQMSVVSDVASGDWDTSDNRSAHLRISLMSSGTLTERLRIRSTGVLYGANIILADANKAGYTNEGIPLSSSGQWENIVSLAGDNCTLFGAILAASSGPAYTASLGIIKSGLDFRHSNSVTAKVTQALYPIAYDAQGHITSSGTAVTSLPTPNSLVLRADGLSVEGTSQYTFDGSVAKTLNIIGGSNVSISKASGQWTFSSVNTTYSAGTGLSLSGTTFNHSNSVLAQGTQALRPIAIDGQGHISAYGSAVTSLPTPSSLILRADGLTSEGTGQYTFNGSSAKTLNVVGGSNVSIAKASGQWTISSTNTTYSAGTGLSLSGTTFNHSNSVTGQATQSLRPIAIDAQGHITSYGSAVTSLPTPSSLILRADGLTSEGTEQYTFDGSVAKTLNVVGGTNVSIAKTSGQWTISSTDTTYPITNREIAYGTGTGITSNSSLSWDTSNYYIRLFRASNTAQTDIRFYLENATGDRRIGNNRSMGRIRFYGAHDSSTYAVGISVDAITDGDWAVNETRSTRLGLYMRHQNVDSYVYTFKSNGSIYSSSLAFSDGNKSGYTNDSMPLSASGQWENIVSLAGNNCTLFGAILAASQKALIPATSVCFGGADNSLTGNALYFKYLTSFRHLRLGNSSPIYIDEVLDSLYVEGALEIKGESFLRNNIHMLANVDVYDKLRIRPGAVLTFGSDDRATITLSSTGTGSVDGLKIGVPNTMGNYMLICRNDQLSTDWSKTSSTDPVLYIQSGLASANYYTALSCNTNGTSSIVAGQGGIEFRHRTQTSSNIANRDMSFGSNNSSSTNNGFNYMFGYNNTIDSASSYSNIVLGNDCSANSRLTLVRGRSIVGWWDGANHFGCRKIQDADSNGDTQAMDGLCISQFHTANNSTKYFSVLGSSTTPFVVTPGHICWISMKVLSTTPGGSGSNYGNYALHNVELSISHTPGGTLTIHLHSVERVSYSGIDIEFSSLYNSVSGNSVSLGFRRTFCAAGSTATSYHVAHVYSAKLTKGFIYSGPA